MFNNQADCAGEATSAPFTCKTPGRARRHVFSGPRISALLVLILYACADGGTDPVVAGGSPFSEPKGALAIEPASVTLAEGEGISLKAKLGSTQVVASHVTWSVSPADVASVDRNGILKGLSRGEATVTARFASSQATSLATVFAPPKTIEAESSQFQIGIVGRTLANSVAVRAVSADGTPVPGVDINFEILSGDGVLSHAERATDADGVARVDWTLGTVAGDQRVSAWAAGLGEMSFQADALPDYDSARVVALEGENQKGVVTTLLPEALTAQVTDQFGNALSGLAVEWSFGDGGGLMGANTGSPEPVLASSADERGMTQVLWALGAAAGYQQAKCTPVSAAGSPGAGVEFTAEAVHDTVVTTAVEPGTSSITVGQTLQFEFSAQDVHGNLVAPTDLEWESSNHLVATVTSAGLATGRSQGLVEVTASAAGVSGSAILTVSSSAVAVVSIAVSPSRVTLGGLEQTVVLTGDAYDSLGEAVPGVSLEWASLDPTIATVSQGGVLTSRAFGQVLIVASAACCAVSDTVIAQVNESVNAPQPTLTQLVLSPADATLAPGSARQFAVTGIWSDGATTTPIVNWTASGGTVNSGGRFQAGAAEGAFWVAASSGETTAHVPVRVSAQPVASLTLFPSSLDMKVGMSSEVSVTVKDTSGAPTGRSVTWHISDTTVVRMTTQEPKTSGASILLGVGVGRALIVGEAGGVADTTEVVVRRKSDIQLGLHMDLTWYNDRSYRQAFIARAAALNASVSRNSLLWHLVEPVKGERDWSVVDTTIDDLVAGGFEPVMVIYGSPAWANGTEDERDPYRYLMVPADPTSYQRWVSEYRDFLQAAARRYRGKVRLWEIGNEQNYVHFWQPKPNIAQYAYWYEELRSAIKSEDPGAMVAMGGLTLLAVPNAIIGANINGVSFLEGVYGLGVFPDAVAVHPYADNATAPDLHVPNAQNFDDIEAVRAVMLKNGQEGAPVWVTEWGWSIKEVTEDEQATFLRRSLELLDEVYGSYVTVATYFTLTDLPPNWFHGLTDRSGRLRAAGREFSAFIKP